MIEGLQVVCQMPLFDVKCPGNVQAFNDFLAEVAKFNIIDTTGWTGDLFHFPEMDPVSLNFQGAGILTDLLIPSLGALFYMILGYIDLFTLHFLLYLISRCIRKVDRARDKVARYLYWNGSIRMMMEGYMDFVLFSL